MFFNISNLPLSARFMFLSALGFALMSCCVKLVSTHGIPVLEIVAARSLVSIIISYVDVKRKSISIWGNEKRLLFARGFVGCMALICVYYSVTTLPLAEATILQYLHPVFTALLAMCFLKEKIQSSTILCIVFSVIGLLVILTPKFINDANIIMPWLSIGAAIIGAAGSALAYVIVKQLNQSEDVSVIIFYFPLVALPVSMLLLGSNFVIPSPNALFLLLFVGIFTQIGQIGLTKAMQTESANKAVAYSYLQVVLSILLGWLLFKEVPSIWTLMGGTLIILGAFINVFSALRPREIV